MEEKQQRTGRDSIFISHRTADAMIAEMLLDYIAGCGIPKDRIFCSSIPGNDVDEKISSEVKQKLKRATIIILILSKDYYESSYCLNEAGVAWYLDEAKSIPIGLPEIDHSKMVGFLNEDYKLRRLDNDNDVAYIIDQTLERLNLNSVVRHGIITQETKKLIHRYRKYIEDRDVTPEKGGTHNKRTGEEEDDNRYTPTIGKDDMEYIPVEPAFLLVYAANGNGQIMRVQTLGALAQVSADGKQFMADMSHRESARWVEALDALVCWGWVKPVGNKGHVYELTGTGYQRAEWLKENMQINTENEPLEELKEF